MQKLIKYLICSCIILNAVQLSFADGIDRSVSIEPVDALVDNQSLDEISPDGDATQEKQCLTVCDSWGTQCIINQDAGRKCRRICESFVQECF